MIQTIWISKRLLANFLHQKLLSALDKASGCMRKSQINSNLKGRNRGRAKGQLSCWSREQRWSSTGVCAGTCTSMFNGTHDHP